MLYGNTSISHYTRSNIAIWMAMAFQAGLINVGGFMACHRFVSHVTGFATFFGREISNASYGGAFGMLSVPIFFLIGAMISGQLVDIKLQMQQKPRYYITFGVIFGLILLVLIGGVTGHFGIFSEPLDLRRDYELLALLCLVCGIQNGTITTVSRSVVRTTHLTGITTDLGIGLVRVFHQSLLDKDMSNEVKANLMRFGIIFFFGMGSVIGAFAFKNHEYYGFVLPTVTSGTLFAIMVYYQVIKRHQVQS